MGMMPKNSLSEDVVKKNLILIRGPYHNFDHVGLPQFTVPLPFDVNEYMPHNTINKDNSYIEFTTDPDNIPDDIKDLPVKIDDLVDMPINYMKKSFV